MLIDAGERRHLGRRAVVGDLALDHAVVCPGDHCLGTFAAESDTRTTREGWSRYAAGRFGDDHWVAGHRARRRRVHAPTEDGDRHGTAAAEDDKQERDAGNAEGPEKRRAARRPLAGVRPGFVVAPVALTAPRTIL